MRFEPDDLTKLVGGAAESWTVSPDGKSITFKLRPGMKFHSGNPVTAEDAAFSLQRAIKLDKTPAFIVGQLGWTKDNVDTMVKALDDTSFEITIAEPFSPSFVLSLMSSVVGSVVDKKTVLAHETNGDLGNAWLKTNSAGSGPFVLRSWKANESVILDAFPGYRSGAPGVKRVVVRHVPEAAAQRLLVEKGDADIARDLTPDQVGGLSGNKDVTIMNVPRAALHYVALNLKTAPFANVKVRQALHYLVDYQGMVSTFLKGQVQDPSERSGRRDSGPPSTRRPTASTPPRRSSFSPKPAIPTASRSRSTRRTPHPTRTSPSPCKRRWRKAASR